MLIAVVCHDVINFEIGLSLFMKPFFYMIKTVKTKI